MSTRATEKQAAYHASMRKLTPEQKAHARQLYNTSQPKPSISYLAKYFGVSKSTIFRIVNTVG